MIEKRKEVSIPQYKNLQGSPNQQMRSIPAPARRKEVSSYQYPYPAEPRNWNDEERLYARGLRRLFDILFSRKLQNMMIADKAISARTIADGAVQIRHLTEGFGSDLDISGNDSVTTLNTAVSAAQRTADQAVLNASAAQRTADQAVLNASAAQRTADQAVLDAAAAKSTADGLTDKLMPIGITIIADTAPAWGTWTQITVDTMTAWTRTA